MEHDDTDPDLKAAYALETPDDNIKLYAKWAQTYDSGFVADMGYAAPKHVAQAFVNTGGTGHVLDLGAGTGLCGAALRDLGVARVDATDISPDMLDVARDKDIYDKLFEGNLLEQLPVETGTYDGAVSSGTFTHGHVGPSALNEVLRVVRDGGCVALSVNLEHWEAQGFEAAFAALGAQISDLAWEDVLYYDSAAAHAHGRDRGRIVTFRKAGGV